MWILVHVTDSVRPADAFVTYPPTPPVRRIVAAAEGMAAPVSADRAGIDGMRRDEDDLARRRHRKAHSLRRVASMLRTRGG
jgi:hypothetical protein